MHPAPTTPPAAIVLIVNCTKATLAGLLRNFIPSISSRFFSDSVRSLKPSLFTVAFSPQDTLSEGASSPEPSETVTFPAFACPATSSSWTAGSPAGAGSAEATPSGAGAQYLSEKQSDSHDHYLDRCGFPRSGFFANRSRSSTTFSVRSSSKVNSFVQSSFDSSKFISFSILEAESYFNRNSRALDPTRSKIVTSPRKLPRMLIHCNSNISGIAMPKRRISSCQDSYCSDTSLNRA